MENNEDIRFYDFKAIIKFMMEHDDETFNSDFYQDAMFNTGIELNKITKILNRKATIIMIRTILVFALASVIVVCPVGLLTHNKLFMLSAFLAAAAIAIYYFKWIDKKSTERIKNQTSKESTNHVLRLYDLIDERLSTDDKFIKFMITLQYGSIEKYNEFDSLLRKSLIMIKNNDCVANTINFTKAILHTTYDLKKSFLEKYPNATVTLTYDLLEEYVKSFYRAFNKDTLKGIDTRIRFNNSEKDYIILAEFIYRSLMYDKSINKKNELIMKPYFNVKNIEDEGYLETMMYDKYPEIMTGCLVIAYCIDKYSTMSELKNA